MYKTNNVLRYLLSVKLQ